MDPFRRKIQPIYEALDVQNYTKAIKLCNRLDVKGIALVEALKAHAFERTGRAQEAVEICDRVVPNIRTDDETLTATLQLVYKMAGAFDKACDMYESVCKKFPNNENLAIDLLGWYIRTGQIHKFQMSSMKMCRQFNNKTFLLWSATSILIQADNLAVSEDLPDDAVATAKQKVQLAKGMISKILADDPPKDKAAARNTQVDDVNDSWSTELLLNVYSRMNNYTDLLALLEKEKSSTATTNTEMMSLAAANRLLLQAENEELAGNTDAAKSLYLEFLKGHDADNWKVYESVLHAYLPGGAVDDAVVTLLTNEFTQLKTKHPLLRGPQLAQIALQHRVFMIHPSPEATTNYLAAVMAYLEAFDTKPCCFGDLRNLLLPFSLVHPALEPFCCGPATQDASVLPGRAGPKICDPIGQPICVGLQAAERERRWPLDRFPKRVDPAVREELISFCESRIQANRLQPDAPRNVPLQKKQLRTLLSNYQVLKYVGFYEDECSSEQVVKEAIATLFDEYISTLPLNEKAEGGQREVQVGDDLVLLIAHLLGDLALRSKVQGDSSAQVNYIREAAVVLEFARKNSPYNFQFSLMLIELYAKLGAFSPQIKAYNRLEVKFIQVDSLSHLMLGDALDTGYFTEAHQGCIGVQTFSYSSRRDNPEYMIRAFRNGNFPKVLEFNRLHNRIQTSHQLAVAQCEGYFLDLMLNRSEDVEQAINHVTTAMEKTGHLEVNRPETRIGQVVGKNLANLCHNYDFLVRESWDCPGGFSNVDALKDLDAGASFSPMVVPPRAAAVLDCYKVKWTERANGWIQFRVLLARFLQENLTFAQTTDDEHASMVQEFDDLVAKLGLDQDPVHKSIWSVMRLMFELSLRFARCTTSGDSPKISAEEQAEMAESHGPVFESAQAALDEFAEAYKAKAKGLNQPHGSVTHLAALDVLKSSSFFVCNQFIWGILMLRKWSTLFTRSKKKNNAAPLRQLVQQLTAKFQQVMMVVHAQMSDMRVDMAVVKAGSRDVMAGFVLAGDRVPVGVVEDVTQSIQSSLNVSYENVCGAIDNRLMPLLKKIKL